MQCPACSRLAPDEARFCPACGSPLTSAEWPTFTNPPGPLRRPTRAPDEQPRTAGTMLAGRYRIVGLLGRGGMGEVYRADDLRLGQSVALKFLPASVVGDPAALARFHNEVRVARQVSHPNVCRIYDLAEADGEPFLSMEYVDGEDLASLLRRIGRLPSDKAVEVARQLCAGLSAAHDLGVLHRDLKPANVMIDGRGRVKIADFGLADVAERLNPREFAGTPAYMAPEQLTGKGATIRTDLYALGLVLYEVFTGKPAFIPGSLQDRARASAGSTPPTPSGALKEIDPAVERVIVRCLDPDPAKRPPSGLAVAAALPGGDPLAAALAAGETPSPEMVAAAGGVGSLRPIVAWGCFLAIVVGIAIVALLNERVGIHRVALEISPEVLAARARDVLKRAGHDGRPVDSARGFEYDQDYLSYLTKAGSGDKWSKLADGRPALIRFWYREGARPLVPWSFTLTPTSADPPATVSGMATVVLDPKGRLLRLTIGPPEEPVQASAALTPDWSVLFGEAGLRLSDFRSAPPLRTPPVYADTREAWEGVFPEDHQLPLRIEAAAYAGRPVYFELVGPWPRADLILGVFPRSALAVVAVVAAGLMIGAALLARRNLRLGRSDRSAASGLFLYVFLLGVLPFLFGTHHVPAIEEVSLLLTAAAQHLSNAAALWLAYVAFEPYVRRRWPDLIISSTRLLAGRLRDPLVGRDILVGGVFGITNIWLQSVYLRIGMQLEWPGIIGGVGPPGPLSSAAEAVGWLSQTQIAAITNASGLMLLLLILSLLLRRRTLATTAVFLVVWVLFGSGLVSNVATIGLWAFNAAIVTVVVTRFGVLASMSMNFFVLLMLWYPLTLDLTAFYAPSALLACAVALGLAWYGLYTSLGGKPLAGWTLQEDS